MTHHAAWHMWRLSEAGEDNLGLACSDDGLLIGRTPLIEKRDGHFVVRKLREIERLLSCAYRSEISADRIMSGLATVARALNADDQCLARIAAVHLRVSDIPDRAARDAMEATDVFIKYARDEGGGEDSNWNPALHRTPAGSRRPAVPANHFPDRPHKMTIRRDARMFHRAPMMIGYAYGPDRSGSTNSRTSLNGSQTLSRRIRPR